MITGIDHVLIAVEDLNQAMAAYRRLGFSVLPGGEHPRMGTYNALVPLADGAYLELIAVRDRALAERFPHTGGVLRALARPNRLAGFALESDDLDADIVAARSRGLAIQGPFAGERQRPDGKRVAWQTAHPQDPDLPFLIQDVTARAVRIPAPETGIGTGLAMAELVVGGQEDAFARLLGIDPVGGYFRLQRGAVQIHTDAAESGIQKIILSATDLGMLESSWRSNQVAFETASLAGVQAVVPNETAGASLEIAAPRTLF